MVISKRVVAVVVLMLFSQWAFSNGIEATKPVPPVQGFITEAVSQVKLAKDYFMNSPDLAAGNSYETRVGNFSAQVQKILGDFAAKRKLHYSEATFIMTGSDWATAKQTWKTIVIPADTYTFKKIVRTEDGDWKKGPYINGVDRSAWREGAIPGGNVKWLTGGYGKARTKWTIDAVHSKKYIDRIVSEELKTLKQQLSSQGYPTEV